MNNWLYSDSKGKLETDKPLQEWKFKSISPSPSLNQDYMVLLELPICVRAQSHLTLCDPMDCSLPGTSVPGIFQARILEWVAISFSNAWKWKVKVKSLSRAWLLATPVDCSPPGSSVHGIFQARVLEWGAIVFSICVCAYVYMHTHIWDNLFKSGTGQFGVCLQYLNFVLYFMCYVDINLHRPKF